jgi:hypothetical protein
MKNTVSRRRSRTTFRPRLESLETRLTPTTYTVSSLADSGAGSLRAAITSVNSDDEFSGDVIDFSVAGVIQLTSGALPAITSQVKIDGTTAPGFVNVPVVEIDNHGFAGLNIGAPNSSLASLSIVNANGPGVRLEGATSTVVGNYIGLALDGSVAPNTGVGLFVDLTNRSASESAATIGGTAPADRNVISGNGAGGIQLGSSGEQTFQYYTNILGNFIGTDITGQEAAANQGNGITVFSSGYNSIGGTAAGAGNTIAFNSQSGVVIDGSSGPVDNVGSQTAIVNNSIFNNGSKGIVLQNNGNANLPAPRLSMAMESPSATTGTSIVQIGGVLNVAIPGESSSLPYTIQVYATLNGVPAGQGQLFLGSVQVTTNVNGFAKFTLSNLSVPASDGTTFTATASLTESNQDGFFTLSTSAFSNSIGTTTANQAYVANVYLLLLNRVPDPSSSVWVNALNNGTTPAAVVLAIESSQEYLSDQVAAMYNRYLGRNPDSGGQQFWTSFLQAGGTFEEMAAQLTASSEYFAFRGGTNYEFVAGLYIQVLQRGVSPSEIPPWVTLLDNGVSRLDVAGAFLTSPEYQASQIENSNPSQFILYPMTHTPYYFTFLLRSADQGGLTAWVNALNAGATDQEVLAGIFGSPEGYQLWS